MDDLTCARCGKSFSLSAQIAQRYPGWRPKLCSTCHTGETSRGRAEAQVSCSEFDPGAGAARARRAGALHQGAPRRRLYRRRLLGQSGPWWLGRGVRRGDEIVAQEHGHEAQTTNNRMELTALIAGYRMISADDAVTLYSDSQLCVRTINEWAAQWEARGLAPQGRAGEKPRAGPGGLCPGPGSGPRRRCAGSRPTTAAAGTSTPTPWPRPTCATSCEPRWRHERSWDSARDEPTQLIRQCYRPSRMAAFRGLSRLIPDPWRRCCPS